jgi:hypothetical protein
LETNQLRSTMPRRRRDRDIWSLARKSASG